MARHYASVALYHGGVESGRITHEGGKAIAEGRVFTRGEAAGAGTFAEVVEIEKRIELRGNGRRVTERLQVGSAPIRGTSRSPGGAARPAALPSGTGRGRQGNSHPAMLRLAAACSRDADYTTSLHRRWRPNRRRVNTVMK